MRMLLVPEETPTNWINLEMWKGMNWNLFAYRLMLFLKCEVLGDKILGNWRNVSSFFPLTAQIMVPGISCNS